MLLGKLFNHSRLRIKPYLLIGNILLFVTLNAIIIYSPFIPKNIELSINDISDTTITSPRYLAFESSVDKKVNKSTKKQIENSIAPVYSINKTINHAIIENIHVFFEDILSRNSNNYSIYIKQLLNEKDIQTLKSLEPNTLIQLKNETIETTNLILSSGIKEINETTLKATIQTKLSNYKPETHPIISKIILHYLQPNITIDHTQTQLIIKQALHSIIPQKTTYKQGQPIIYENEQVTAYHIEVFKALNMYDQKAKIKPFLGILLLTGFSFIILDRFIFLFYKKAYSLKKLTLVFLIITILNVFALFILKFLFTPKLGQLFFLIPIPLAAMLLTTLISTNIALLTGTLISAMIALMSHMHFETFIFLFISNCISAYFIRNTSKRSDLIIAGYKIGSMNILVILSLGLIAQQTNYSWYVINMLSGLGNGIASAMISLAILPYLEHFFKITTNQTLLELSNLNHPILKRLMMDAPGTYQHSLMVANFSEAAAEAIGANAVLCRVGSYFHDIGKLKRPIFFSENQFSENNPHDTIAPRISKLIITSHVKEGLELAKKHKLPDSIQDIIEQHHGTSLLTVFYSHAIAKEGKKSSADEEFRYTGPKPQTKEAGIIMLADAVEAATRALKKPTPQKIESTINKIIKTKLDDKQLSECPLSFNEIFIIQSTFSYLLIGMKHSRVDYNKEIENLTTSSDFKSMSST